jgi:hypothetical protein
MIDLTLVPTAPLVDDRDQLVMFQIPRRLFLDGRACWHCGVDHGEFQYMLHKEVWLEATGEYHGPVLCVACLEAMLGRQLRHDDFDFSVPLTRGVGSPGWKTASTGGATNDLRPREVHDLQYGR